ncbi:rhamnogalacturonan acetylesterase [Pontibacter qinzhouensis]|uniref:Rhamnogalacturonan acetylesterase n=1 Tax=Pontibacter qinzhouensis TaxID=2603253 RepID=A0A5C8IMY0_9BACT|nr:rhamnogalacturonan acetylesterase [Pontibacter qinzhouensis]TXK22481.1 rhamnogalacturonan acetylesterase [Pontibacter qinzhouensis]
MKNRSIIKPLAAALLLFSGAASAQQTSFRFDFGSGKTAKKYLPVPPATPYGGTTGYGFDLGTSVTAVSRKNKNPLTSDFVTSDQAFYFSVAVPEGNYKVTLTLGDLQSSTQSTVKAESRRLMLEQLQTEPGQVVTQTFVVNIKNRQIDNARQVSLKPREETKLDWDDKLTLEFSAHTALSSLEIEKVEDQVTVYLAGNSTVVNQEEEPWASWGQMIPRFFGPGVAIANHAESGLSLGSFMSSKRLDKVMSIIKPGDFLFIEFGHNDEKEKGPEDGPYKSYTERLRFFVKEVKSKGATPIILTPTARRSFNASGEMTNSHGDYPDAARKVAAAEQVALIDLTQLTTTLYETLGPEGSKKAFVIYPEQGLNDNTHFNTYGAYQIAKLVVQEIKNQNLSLSTYLRQTPDYLPTHPDDFEKFNLPASPKGSLTKPDGN